MIMQTMTKISNNDVINTFKNILNSLSEKERCVIEKRIGLNWKKETLQNIWDNFSPNITRERVRQIEDSWIKKIWRIIKATQLSDIQDKSKEIISMHGWILTKDKLINAVIKELNLSNDINKWIIESIIHSDFDIVKSKPKLWTKNFFYLPKISKKLIDSIHIEALKILKKKKDVIEKNTLFEMIRINLSNKELNNVFIDSVLDIYEDIITWEESLIWLTKWKILNPKTLKDKAVYILRKEKIPMHFIQITNKISETMWEKAKVNTVHNELIRNKEFVLVGRWIYALKDWWIYKPWTVIDVIMDVLKKSWEPMTTEEITNKVLKVRQVKPTTIYMNLQNKQIIQRVWRNYYQLKSN